MWELFLADSKFNPGSTSVGCGHRGGNLSNPLKWLLNEPFFGGKILDYGAGRGHDVECLRSLGYLCDGFDKYVRNDSYIQFEDDIKRSSYDVVLVTYVLNTVLEDMQWHILWRAFQSLKMGGTCYVTVRRDLPFNQRITVSKDGLWSVQRDVVLDEPWELAFHNCKFAIYKRIKRNDE